MSVDSILKLFKDFENFKYLYFNEKQFELFDHMRCLTFKEHFLKIEKIYQNKLSNFEISNILREISQKETLNNKIIQKILDNN